MCLESISLFRLFIEPLEESMAARIVIVSRACGTGKTSIARLLAKNSTYAHAIHIHTDDFYQYVRKGYMHFG